ncbi:MAG TPA: aminotransferase class V-fold PLP-dependent enzyme [Vicinamibacterales bacterium]|nr:aminotransferase class V-fold PLP-dependent enzyme [Vicinamibacterales bacterium]
MHTHRRTGALGAGRMERAVVNVRALFPGLDGTIYLNTATMGVGCAPARAAYERAVDQWSRGKFDWLEAERAGEDARSFFAELIGGHADEVAIIPTVSAAAGLVAANLPAARSGENVVVGESEFSSNFFPWARLRERGYDVRTVAAARFGEVDAFAGLTDAGTRLIAVSAVHSPTGYRADLRGLGQVAKQSGAWFFVDACQAAGAVPLDVARDGIDFLAAASHKFLLSARGMGYLYVRRALLDRIHPIGPGWKAGRKPLESFYGPAIDLSPTASKLDMSLVWFAALAEQATFAMFRGFGIDAILERNAHLSRRLHEALAGHVGGFEPFPAAHRSTIVSVEVRDTDQTLARLRDANVIASVRAGRVRLAVHFYNLEEEIDRVAELLGAE